MSIPELLYTLLIGPLEALFETVYTFTYNCIENPGLSIIGLSLVMNVLLLPLYKRTDAIQMEAIETEKQMQPIVTHIKKTFKGNEQFMMLQTCYRQNHYKPTDALKGLSPLILEIPFFMAAYRFLSELELLRGTGLGPITNLGAPDGLLTIGGIAINILPVLMTFINVISSLIYTKDAPIKTKIQLYGMAALFLILLYDSPAGLVFYWTLNNLFSLIKNVLMKTKKPMLIVSVSATMASVLCVLYVVISVTNISVVKVTEILTVALLLNIPLVMYLSHKFGCGRQKKEVVITGKNKTSFLLSCLVMTLLIGVMIPVTLIHTSPEEFIVIGSGVNPMIYIRYTALVSAGFFIIWLGLFYMLAKPSGKKIMEFALWMVCGISIADYMWFGKKYGILTSRLTFENSLNNTAGDALWNLCVLAALVGILYWIWVKKPDILRMTGIAAVIAMTGISAVNAMESQKIITNKMEQIEPPPSQLESIFQLSTTGKNVIVLMLDRGINSLVPYMFYEKPELQEQFAGFTYYPNTLSFGSHTNVGLPSVFGGYEYTPLEMNRRDRESLESKHNEALKVMPVLFQKAGYDTTVCDPTYAGYDWIPDLSVFNDFPQIKTHITMGHYNNLNEKTDVEDFDAMKHKFLFYSIFKSAPVFLHEYIYDSGSYQNLERPAKQFSESTVKSYGISDAFQNSYNVLKNLTGLTEITDKQENTFMMMCNETTHSPQLLQLPNYTPLMYVDNTRYDQKHPERVDAGGNKIVMTRPGQVQHYHCNMASFLEIGKWLDYLRENNVFDNTRIIIVSDHGYFLHLKEELEFGDRWDEDIMYYHPLLMIKDFSSRAEFKTDETFMTNADVPTLTMQGLIENPVNPFTGKAIHNEEKDKGVYYLLASHHWDVTKNNGNTYIRDNWIKVQGDMKNKDNWRYVNEWDLP